MRALLALLRGADMTENLTILAKTGLCALTEPQVCAMLTGGGAQLHGLTEYLSEELKVEVTVSPDPVNCVALGTAMSLGLNDKLETGFLDATPRIGRR